MTAGILEDTDISEYMDLASRKPVSYARQCLGLRLWEKQRRVLKLATQVPLLSVRSGNGVGKTYLTGGIICQYLDTHCPGYAIVSSSSWTQVQKTVWPTLRKIVREAPVHLGGTIQLSEWKRGLQWGAFCVSPDEPENFSGFRTKNGCLIIVDEASALTQDVHEAIMGLSSAAGSRVIYLGNPLRPEGPFYETFGSQDWTNVHISTEEVLDLGIPGLADREWVEARKREWGEDSPMYKARVLGEFPDSSASSLIKLAWLKFLLVPRVLKPQGTRKMGVDVARYGDDRTVLVIRDARCVIDVLQYSGKSTMETVGLILDAARKYHIDEDNIFVDDSGLGGGVTDRLHEQEVYIIPVNFGERASDADRFRNTRAELYWAAREHSREDAADKVFIPKQFSELAKEMTWTNYTMDSQGRIALEKKEEVKKRKHRSPDLADAYVLTFANSGDNFEVAVA